MLISSMGKMMEELAPSSVHVLAPTRPAKATGLNQRVYTQMRRDFMVAGPFVLHSDDDSENQKRLPKLFALFDESQ